MNSIKQVALLLCVFLSACQTGKFENQHSNDPIIAISSLVLNQSQINSLPPAERCEHIRVDLRKECRAKAKKELDELAKAMQSKKND